jgi:Yip1 domain
MNAILRVPAILTDPFAEWARIEKEPDDLAYLLLCYVALLALIPAVFGFIGACLVGAVVPGKGLLHASIFDGIFGAIFGYVLSFVTVALLGLFIDLLAPQFGGRRDFASAFRLAVYSYTPVWLTGAFLLLPGLRFLMLIGFYGAYILMAGLPRLMKSAPQKSAGFAALVTLCAFVLTMLAATTQRALFGTPGF